MSIDHWLHYTGVAVWSVCAVGAVVFLIYLALSVATSVSNLRWHLGDMKVHGRTVKWRLVPLSFLRNIIVFYGYRNDGTSYREITSTGSVWRGIGDWTINRSKATACVGPDDEEKEEEA